MNKNKITILLLLLLGIQYVKSQIVLDTTDLPDIGNIQISVNVDSIQGKTLDAGEAGENIVWDFSALSPCCGNNGFSNDTLLWISPILTPNGQYFNSSNLSDAMNCFTYHSHVTHQNELECDYFYYVKNTTGLLLYGMDKQNNIILNKYYNLFPLLSYGSTTSNASRIREILNDTLFVTYILSRSTADAWGSITTPAGSINAIRVYTTESVYDSIYVSGAGYLTSVTNDNYYYRWYAKGLKYPVLEIFKGIKHQKRFSFQKAVYAVNLSSVNAAIKNQSFINNFNIYPNPVINSLSFQSDQKFIDFNMSIYNFLGDEIFKINNIDFDQKIDLSYLNAGTYFYKIISQKEFIASGKLIKL